MSKVEQSSEKRTEDLLAQTLWKMAVGVAKTNNDSVCRDLENVKGERFVENTTKLLNGKKLHAITYYEIAGRILVFEKASITDTETLFSFLDAIRNGLFEAKTANETHAEIPHLKAVNE